jgi:hypothetical protein
MSDEKSEGTKILLSRVVPIPEFIEKTGREHSDFHLQNTISFKKNYIQEWLKDYEQQIKEEILNELLNEKNKAFKKIRHWDKGVQIKMLDIFNEVACNVCLNI